MRIACALARPVVCSPFAGGSYGYARATIGKVAGYFVGVSETLGWPTLFPFPVRLHWPELSCDVLARLCPEYIMYVAATVFLFGRAVTELGAPASLEPLWWTAVYGTGIVMHLSGGKWCVSCCAVLCRIGAQTTPPPHQSLTVCANMLGFGRLLWRWPV